MLKTKYSRKLDSTGRLVIPSKLRERLNLMEGQLFDFYIHRESGKTYLCITNESTSELDHALDVIRKNGFEIKGESNA